MKKEEVPLKNILTFICYSFSSKNLKSIVNTLKEKMLEDKLITLESKKSLFDNKEVVKVDGSKFMNIIEEVKKEFLGKGTLTEDLILLASLLNSTRFLKNIFNKYEKEELANKLKEIKDTEVAKKVKIAQSVISNMSAMITVMMVNATSSV